MKKNWITLYSDTFLWIKGKVGFVYSAKNHKRLHFYLTNRIEKICEQLLNIENLYTSELTTEDIKDNEVSKWLQSLINIHVGYLKCNIEFTERPVSLKPILKIQNKKEYYELMHSNGEKGEILQNLHELTFYINGSEYGNNEFYKQHIYPLNDYNFLDRSKILSFINNSKNLFLSNINLVGNLFSYFDFERLIQNIYDFSIQFTIYVTINDFLKNKQKIINTKWPINVQFNLLVDTVFDITFIRDISFSFFITVFVFSEDDFIRFSNIFETFETDYKIFFIPIYNKENLVFFKKNIFIDEKDLQHIDLSKNEIFMRQSFNIGNFGRLTIMPDGKVYANVNSHPLGSIDDSPYSLVYKEFIAGKSWFKLRDDVPCNDCIYQWLCPSPSNYEIVIDKPNLCHVKP